MKGVFDLVLWQREHQVFLEIQWVKDQGQSYKSCVEKL